TFQLLKSLLKINGRSSFCLPLIHLVLSFFDFHVEFSHPRPIAICRQVRSTLNVTGVPLKRLMSVNLTSHLNQLRKKRDRIKLSNVQFMSSKGLNPQSQSSSKALPPLPNADKYATIVTRFAPNPDFVLHLGSIRAIILSHDYARMYKGRFLL